MLLSGGLWVGTSGYLPLIVPTAEGVQALWPPLLLFLLQTSYPSFLPGLCDWGMLAQLGLKIPS